MEHRALFGALVASALTAECASAPVEPPAPPRGLLLRADFDGATLDPGRWTTAGPLARLGRTQLRAAPAVATIVDGILRLPFDTWSGRERPTFLGTELRTRGAFAPTRGNTLTFVARARLTGAPSGVVAAMFLYGARTQDELDLELLSRLPGSVLTNVYRQGRNAPDGRPEYIDIPGFDVAVFHELAIDWTADRVRWRVDGAIVREDLTRLDVPMTLRLNVWAPDVRFAPAFDGTLVPATAPAANRTAYWEIDWIEIRETGPSAMEAP